MHGTGSPEPGTAQSGGRAATVLVVSHDGPQVARLLDELELELLRAEVVEDPEELLGRVATRAPDLVLVDLTVAGPGALDLCRGIQARCRAPIVVTGHASDADPVAFLDVVDDFVAYPDRVHEVVARVRAVLRRSSSVAVQPPSTVGTIEVGDVRLDRARHVVAVRGKNLHLPLKQFQLLELLLENAGIVLPRSTIINRIWGTSSGAASNTLEVQIKRLRAAIEEDVRSPRWIKTVRGFGYTFVRPSSGP